MAARRNLFRKIFKNLPSSTKATLSTSSKRPFPFSSRLKGFDNPTVWHEFTPLAQKYNAANLGQGFPDWTTPSFVKQALKQATEDGFNQYTRGDGHLRLVHELAGLYTPLFGRNIDPLEEITVSVGATEALFGCIQAFVEPGDEVVLLEPAYDAYSAQVQMAYGVSKYVPLEPNKGERGTWGLDLEKFEKAFSNKTRILILNNPHNPLGKVFSKSELEDIAAVVRRHPGVIVLCDEVYEFVMFDNLSHIRFATLPGMWDQTITISSAGKTFSATGWKIGWQVGPNELIKPAMLANQWIQFSVSTTLQDAVASCLRTAVNPYEGFSSYFTWLSHTLQNKRDELIRGLKNSHFESIVPESGYFVLADTSNFQVPEKFLNESTPACPQMTRDWAFARWLTMEHGVSCIPPSAFYCPQNKHLAANLARFAFCKSDETMSKALERLKMFSLSQGFEE